MKKVLTIVISIALIAAIAIGGTLAYLSSDANKTELKNTFVTSTAGSKLDITLDEGKVNPDTGLMLTGDNAARVTANAYPVIPGASMDKNPTITVKANSSPCYVFAYVTDTATVNGVDAAEIDAIDPNWTLVDSNYPGLYVYSSSGNKIVSTLTTDNALPAVFNKITINPALTVVDTAATPAGEINVQAYAYQASGGVTFDMAKAAAIDLFF